MSSAGRAGPPKTRKKTKSKGEDRVGVMARSASKPILVISLNPAVDVEWRVGALRWVEKNEVYSERRWPGGKGVNVARWLRWLGAPVRLFIPLGGLPGAELRRGLAEEEISAEVFPLKDSTRVNVIVTQESGPQMRLNPQWPRFSGLERRRVLESAERAMARAGLVVLSGALPKTMRPGDYARLIRSGKRLGVPVILDCDGEAFRLGIREQPVLVKPNRVELGEWAGRELKTDAAVRDAARALALESGGWVLVSAEGDGGGLMNPAGEAVRWVKPPAVMVRNTVGTGDAFLAAAALAIWRGRMPAEWLREGVATGTAAVTVAPGCLPKRGEWRRILGQVEEKAW